jgi:hypothetical protein
MKATSPVSWGEIENRQNQVNGWLELGYCNVERTLH